MDAPKTLSLNDLVIRFNKPSRILEVGFGDGEFLGKLCEVGHSVVGTEVSDRMVQETQKQIPKATILLSHDPSGIDGTFDAVCCFEVLEHVPDPISLARQFPANLFFGSVPNAGRWYPRLTGRYEYWDFPPNHLWRFCDCQPLGPDHHDNDCKLGNQDRLAENQRGMSLRWLLKEAGYTRINVRPTPVQSHDLLRMIPIRRVSGDYDNMRHRSMAGRISTAGRKLTLPFTIPAAGVLNLFGQAGVSFYITAERD
jgi:hypothetical protein